jgi:hypothetical protein
MLQFSDSWLLITNVPGRLLDRILRRSPDEKHQVVLDTLGSVCPTHEPSLFERFVSAQHAVAADGSRELRSMLAPLNAYSSGG